MTEKDGFEELRELLETKIFCICVSFPAYLQQREKIEARAMLAKRQVCLANY